MNKFFLIHFLWLIEGKALLCKLHKCPFSSSCILLGVLINSNVIVFWVDTEYEPSAFEWGIQCCQISYDYKLLTDQIPCINQVQPHSSENHLTLIFPKASCVDVFLFVKWLLHEPEIQNAAESFKLDKNCNSTNNDQSEIKIKHWNSWKLNYPRTNHRLKHIFGF